jgi:maltose O-acetyltransferase
MLLEGTVTIGDRLRLHSDAARVEISVAAAASLVIGDEVTLGSGSSIGVTERVQIGDRCRIGPHVQIMDNDFHRLEPERRDERPPSRPVVIGDDVWIAPMALILPGATIASGSVIAARSVVTGEIPPRTLAMGAPARVVRTL